MVQKKFLMMMAVGVVLLIVANILYVIPVVVGVSLLCILIFRVVVFNVSVVVVYIGVFMML